MSEAQTPKRRSTDTSDLESRVSVLETKQDFIIDSIAKIGNSLEKHMSDEDGTVKKFTDALTKMNETVIVNTEALRHLSATFVTHTTSTEKLTTQLSDLDKRVDKHDIEVAKMESIGWTITKVASVISVIIGAIWAIASKFIGT